jgi:hypothetical protein
VFLLRARNNLFPSCWISPDDGSKKSFQEASQQIWKSITSAVGTFRTWRDVRLESAMCFKADIGRPI